MTTEKFMLAPEEPTDEILRAMLAARWPATYKEYLRHPLAGSESKKQQEMDIVLVRKQYLAAMAVIRQAYEQT